MRKSLSTSEPGPATEGGHRVLAVVASAVVLSAALAVVAAIDQVGGRSLADHAGSVYAPHGEHADSGLLYGLVYFVAAVDAAMWWLVLRAVRARKRWAPLLAGLAIVVAATLALTLLTATEYGARIFPPLWGSLAFLSCLPGIAAVAFLLPNKRARSTRTQRLSTKGMTHGTPTH